MIDLIFLATAKASCEYHMLGKVWRNSRNNIATSQELHMKGFFLKLEIMWWQQVKLKSQGFQPHLEKNAFQ